MFDKLPEYIDPIAAVNHHKHIVGRVNQSRLKRLLDVCMAATEEVSVDIQFYYDKAVKFPAFEMKLETVMELECQRSLSGFKFPVKTSVKGIFTESMSLIEDEVLQEYEVFELSEDEDRISLYDLVEEELLLVIPMIPVDEKTEIPSDYISGADEAAEPTESLDQADSNSRPNPFAALKALKK